MFLDFLQTYEVGQVEFLSRSQKHHLFPPHQILEEPRWEFKLQAKQSSVVF
jgi:hypothetical protein